MTSSTSVVKTTNPPKDDFFLCRAFAKAISADKLLQIIEQQPIPTESPVESVPLNDNNLQMIDNSTLSPTNNQWKVGDLCLCPYSEDGLLYKATIIHIDALSCTVSFDDYGNEEIHLLADLQMRIEEQQQESLPSIDEDDILPPPPPPLPPFPILNPNDDNDTLSSTLMSWYLAGYHTGFYQGIKDKK
jgi:survival motor neuron protein